MYTIYVTQFYHPRVLQISSSTVVHNKEMQGWSEQDSSDELSTASESIESADVRQLTNPYSDPMEITRKFRSYEIDHVGNGSFQVSQLNLLARRSLEPVRSLDAQLSARGLHHRSPDVFVKDAANASNIIKGMMRGEKVRSGHYKPSAQLFQPHFTRALANERLQHIDLAIADYTMCLKINPHSSVCYFNRAGLYRLKKVFAKAVSDMHAAVKLDPTNMDYRSYRAMICREAGDYEQAMQDTIVVKAVTRRPELKRLIEKSGEAAVSQIITQHDAMSANLSRVSVALSDDPIVAALEIKGNERSDAQLTLIKDFLKTVKLFAPLSSQATVLTQIAAAVELTTVNKHGIIFSEGDPGHHFFIILDGEVAITKTKILVEATTNNNSNTNNNNNTNSNNVSTKNINNTTNSANNNANSNNNNSKINGFGEEEEAITETIVLVKLFRGQSFGETALESKGGLRTAGAMAQQPARLLSLHVDAYHSILHRFRAALKEEVRALIATNAIFSSWEEPKVEHLASLVVIKQFAANAEIMAANKPVPALMLVKSGIVTLLKAVPRRLLHHQPSHTATINNNATTTTSNGSYKHKNSAHNSTTNVLTNSNSKSSVLFTGETPGLWIVNKGWTTHLDEQTMREHTQYVLEQRLKNPAAASAAATQLRINSNNNSQNNSRPGTQSGAPGGLGSGLGSALGLGSAANTSGTNGGSPQLDAAELDLVELAVGILGSGQVFGELAVLDPSQNSPVSAMASTAVELFCFETDVLAALGARFYAGTMRALLESIALHDPPLDKIGFFYRQKFTWEQHKHQLMQRLQHGVKNTLSKALQQQQNNPNNNSSTNNVNSNSNSLLLPPIGKKTAANADA